MTTHQISKILVADDHVIVKVGIEILLKNRGINAELFYTVDFEGLLSQMRKEKFDLIILDIDIPGGNNVGMIETIRLKDPGVPVLIFTGFSERIYAIPYLRSGANAFVSKESPEEELERAILCIQQGKKYISSNLQQAMLDSIVTSESSDMAMVNTLSKREMDVATLLIKGNSTAQIAQILNLQLSTVSTFKSRIFTKLKVNNVVELIAKMKLVV
ncbi:response regulator transcription factor [Ravibacter arvi]|uniref:Response regulator transcription factor n=1 Tax=Ravibacter arvi TaxID=2051041 RepID=A0ABP8M365_9BACT